MAGRRPSPTGYREPAGMGFTTVVDLRAEDLSAKQLAEAGSAGLAHYAWPCGTARHRRPTRSSG
ncbi:hypothetical protein [Streptomyces sp. NPDC126514]|uniref:hypothetical protein n=1 Tax=Streptomyces sp. NPDC126514 TaxID=3155210 RepID=UPI003328988C